jgi:HAD superfamily 5'-nucleotidase-like hydrolase
MSRSKLFALSRADIPELLDRTGQVAPMDSRRRIFVNRSLRLDKIEVIGFDMDYTIAIYKKDRIEELAFHATVEKLIAKKAYPAEIREIRYEPDRVIRGLVVDKRRGNIFKMDRYGHVGRAYHGSREVDKDEKTKHYRSRRIELDSFGYAWVDTLFSLPEACLYSQLVDFFEGLGASNGVRKPGWRTLYQDVREAIDEAHADNSIKSIIKEKPWDYIERDLELSHAFHRFRSSGKRLFLLTNSHWDYTDAVMRFLLDGALAGYPSWRNYFDHIIVGAQKPLFFTKRNPFRRVDEATALPTTEEVPVLERGRIYQGGNLKDLERLAKYGGERILYVGDHIYGDILRSKKSSLWRTAMIVPELEDVILHHDVFAVDFKRFSELEEEMRRIDYEVNYYKLLLNSLAHLREEAKDLNEDEQRAIREATAEGRESLDRLKATLRALVAEHRELERRIGLSYNRYWTLLFSEGSETSLFGKQVEEYACVYTSRVSNFLYYSPIQYFRSPPHLMPHER